MAIDILTYVCLIIKMKNWFQKTAFVVAFVAISFSLQAQQADFNEVGRQMAIMLQNSHFARLEFNAELSQRFLDNYLRELDFQRLYFTQEDINGFTVKYGDRLHKLLLHGESMLAATEIYHVYESRVEERMALTDKLLKVADFDFLGKESVMVSRKNAPWPKNTKEATDLWSRQIKDAVLGEKLRHELLTKLAREQNKPDPGSSERSPREKVSLRYKRLLRSVKDIDDEEIANYWLSSVASAYDPHTDYMSFRELNHFNDGMKNELVGIGALLHGEEDGTTKITGIVVGGPADRQGVLKLNDRVIGIDILNTGKPEDMIDIMFMKIDKIVDYIRGKEDSVVALKVERTEGAPGETKIVVITRGKVEMKDELAKGQIIEMHLENGINHRMGVLTLPSFYADFDEKKILCSVDVEKILKRLTEEKIDGLILDLRNNPGGSLEEVRRMTGFFINNGPVVQVKNTLGQIEVKNSDSSKPIYAGPMVVMIDKSSASASEILAGALQDFNRAVIVGDSSTFGKGTVQSPKDIGRMLPLFSTRNRAGSLKVTIQKFYRPSGISTQLDGVASNIVIPSMMDSLDLGEKFLDYPLANDRIRPAADFKPLDSQGLYLTRLKELSENRIKMCEDFFYIIEDGVKAKSRLSVNQLSLNQELRKKELIDSDILQKERNVERRKRFSRIGEEDKKSLKFYKLTLNNTESGVDLKSYDPAIEIGEYMRRAKDETADLDQTPKWPSGIDPVKRESLSVLKDLVDLTESAKIAGLLKNSVEIR